MQITRAQINRWADSRRVPYEPGPVEPTTDRFWKAVSEILSTAIRVDLPQSMDPMNDPAEEMEVLFQAVVHPERRAPKNTKGLQAEVPAARTKHRGELQL